MVILPLANPKLTVASSRQHFLEFHKVNGGHH